MKRKLYRFKHQKFREYLQDPGMVTHPKVDCYLNGYCDIFALAASRLFGFKMMAIFEPRSVQRGDTLVEKPGLVHVYCVYKDDLIFDAKGIRKFSELQKEYNFHDQCWVGKVDPLRLFKMSYTSYRIKAAKGNEYLIQTSMNFIKLHYLKIFKLKEVHDRKKT